MKEGASAPKAPPPPPPPPPLDPPLLSNGSPYKVPPLFSPFLRYDVIADKATVLCQHNAGILGAYFKLWSLIP